MAAFKAEFDVVLVVTSTKFTFMRPLTNVSRVVPTPLFKVCRSEAIRGFPRSGPNSVEAEKVPKQIVCSITKRSHLIRNRRLCFRRRGRECVKEQCSIEARTQNSDSKQGLFTPCSQPVPISSSSATITPVPVVRACDISSRTDEGRGAAHSVQSLPRHKRPSHISAEYRRRNKIQKGFDTMKELVPSLTEDSSSSKGSKCAMLTKTSKHIRGVKSDLVTQKDEIAALKKQIAELHLEIECFQAQLPTNGITTVDKPACHVETMYTKYLRAKTEENWKFWLFSFVVRPLFESYNRMVTTSSHSSFLQSVREWAQEHLSLVNLRPCVLSALRQICLKSSILNDSKKLPEEAVQNVMEYCSSHSK